MVSFSSEGMVPEPAKKEGLKYITQTVNAIMKEHKECTYQFICQNVVTSNTETANRRIYDVLNVMRAVKLIGKRKKLYYLTDNSDSIKRKRLERNRLLEMRDSFLYITTRNELMGNSGCERLYLPFMIIAAEKKSEITCDTNDEHSFFHFKSNKPMRVYDDLEILKRIREKGKAGSKEKTTSLPFDSFIF
ncbi:hypothetical protein PAPHI01_0663 [Pancytospora philotis]|nr:hypothetical protein PAPHI01_0663 [Pancytospora philotis]